MKAYSKKAQYRQAKAFVVNEARAILEHHDIVSLETIRKVLNAGPGRLEKYYRGFQFTYEDYQRRYLASDESTLCGDRMDTYVMKLHLKDMGFDYDLMARKYGIHEKTARQADNRAIVFREALPVIEHADLVSLITLHDIEKCGKIRLERYYQLFRLEYGEYTKMYLAGNTTATSGLLTQQKKNRLARIGFNYDALVEELTKG